MASSIFKCKQFEIQQNEDVFALTNDTTLIGAWAEPHPTGRTLEVGSGSGMISIMLAQRYKNILIDAIDINLAAAQLAQYNFKNSKWASRLSAYHKSLNDFELNCTDRYDDVISNPPYHNSTHLPKDTLQSSSRHDYSLPFEELFKNCNRLLKPTGNIHLIIPSERLPDIILTAQHYNYGITRQCNMHPRAHKPAKRSMITLTKDGSLQEPPQILTMYTDLEHHNDYISLLQDFLIIF